MTSEAESRDAGEVEPGWQACNAVARCHDCLLRIVTPRYTFLTHAASPRPGVGAMAPQSPRRAPRGEALRVLVHRGWVRGARPRRAGGADRIQRARTARPRGRSPGARGRQAAQRSARGDGVSRRRGRGRSTAQLLAHACPATSARGFSWGMELRSGCAVPSIGGGLCVLSNAPAELRTCLACGETACRARVMIPAIG